MVKLQINHKDVILLIMDYLREQNLLKSMLALEEETNINLFRYGKEIAFLRQLILDGQWLDVENFLKPAQIRSKIDFNQVLFEIRKQKYIELLETQQLDQHVLLNALKDLEGFCNKEIYNGLCYLLTLQKLSDHPDFINWTVQKGRLQCFESIKTCLSNIYQTQEKRKSPVNRLSKLLRDSVTYQYYIAKQTGSMTKFKFDPATQCSEVSLLKDFINQENQMKFNKQNLNEIKISFYNRDNRQSQQNTTQQYNTQYQSIDYVEDEVAEEIDDDDEEEEEEESQSEYYEHEFAQSMPAHSQAPAQNKQTVQRQQQQPPIMTQSINHNVFAMQQRQPLDRSINFQQNMQQNVPTFKNQEQQYQNAMQQQMANDKTYKSISYHKTRQSQDLNQPEGINTSSYLKKKSQAINQGLKSSVGQSANFDFQRQQVPSHNNTQILENSGDLSNISNYQSNPVNRSMMNFQEQQRQSQQYQHNRNGSKTSQSSGLQGAQFNQQQQQQYQQVVHHQQQVPLEMIPQKRIGQQSNQVSQQNFIFQNDSEQEDKLEEQKLGQHYQKLNQQKIKPQVINSQVKQSYDRNMFQQQQHHQQDEQENDEYDEDFVDQNEDESDRHQQQESVRQIQPPSTKSQQQYQQQQQQHLDTEEDPQQIISDIEPSIDNNIHCLAQRAILVDVQPIRAACFSPRGNHLALGTNSKSLKICALPNFNNDDEDDDLSPNQNSQDQQSQEKVQELKVIFEQQNHHNGSLYCVDWSRTSRLIASGSNDKTIKLLVCPEFDQQDHNELLEMVLEGHQAIVRTVCFNPTNDLILLSGGLVDQDVKVWDSESGKNIANLSGHQGDIYSIKMSYDGSYAFSVGKDKCIMIWDIRAKSFVHRIAGNAYTDMNDICYSSSPHVEGMNQTGSVLGGLACVAHTDGTLTFWDMNMRKCLAQQQAHQSEARGVSFSVDGKYLASAGFDQQIVITDTSDLDNLNPMKYLKHDDKVVSVKWHPFLPLLLSTSADKTARIWYPQLHI